MERDIGYKEEASSLPPLHPGLMPLSSLPTPILQRHNLHPIKLVNVRGRPVCIVLQNSNGPCPLLSIFNTLLLRNEVKLGPEVRK